MQWAVLPRIDLQKMCFMKQLSQCLIIGTFLVACSPKFTEYKDHGFGGGFKSNRELLTKQSIQKEQSLVYNDEKSAIKICDIDTINKTVLHIVRKPRITHKSNVALGENSLGKNKDFGIQKKPLYTSSKSKLSMPNGKTSIWKWILFVIGSLISGFGLYEYIYGMSSSMMGWDVFYIYEGLAILAIGLWLLYLAMSNK